MSLFVDIPYPIHPTPLKFCFKCLSMRTAELHIYLNAFRETQETPRTDEIG